MNTLEVDKVGKFIKKLRKDNNLTQKELADKYGVTYQAVSKWENGINLPEVSLIRQMSKDFNISVEDILDGEVNTKKKNRLIIIPIILVVLSLTIFLILKFTNNSFNFKTISSTCEEFVIEGSIAYDNNNSSIYISKINYCAEADKIVYDTIECKLYEKYNNVSTLISNCKSEKDVTLKDYLDEIKINTDKYSKSCKSYTDESLYLEISATDKENKVTTYKVPLKLENNCNN